MLNAEEQIEVLALVQGTGELIRSEQQKAKVTVKGAADYVTNVDVAVQEYLKRELAKRFPEVRMLAEEQVNTGFVKEGKYWILDPIDGTTNLIHDMKLSAVALGYYENGAITFGVVYNPFMEELFHASAGGGAWLNGSRIKVAKERELKDSVIAFGPCPYEKEKYTEANFALFQRLFLRSADFRRTGSAELDLCYIACGRVEAYLERNLKPWDYSAGSIILTEAGGRISDWEGGALPYLQNADILACAPQLQKELLELIRSE